MPPAASLPPGLDSALALGAITGIDEDGFVVVASATSQAPVACLPLEHVARGSLTPGANVLFWRPAADAETGVIVGVVAPPTPADAPDVVAARDAHGGGAGTPPETLVLEAKSSLVLRVGDGSIEMRADGRIVIKGRDLVSHAKRMNRIKGGAVSIN